MGPKQVRADFDVRLLVPGGNPVPVPATLRFEPDDPFAITIVLHTDGGREVFRWSFARTLLADGMRLPTGVGDVRVRPAGQGRHRTLVLSLSGTTRTREIEISRTKARRFLRDTFASVPLGGEGDLIDWDIEISQLTGYGTQP